MKIWCDIPSLELSFKPTRVYSSECDAECVPAECGPDESSPPETNSVFTDHLNPISTANDWAQIRGNVLQQTTPLYLHSLSQEYWIVCAPVASGRIAVLDREAFELLELFRTPHPPSERTPGENEQELQGREAVVAFFYRSGFLRRSDQPSPTVQQKEETLSAWLHLTNACNLRCTYCYLEKTSEQMADKTSRGAVEAIFRSAVKHQYKRVKLRYAGGEASLRMGHVLAVHKYASSLAQQSQLGLSALLMSNGVALGQHIIETLKEQNIHVGISLDGIDAYHDSQRPFKGGQGSFFYVNRTIEQLLANQLTPSILVTISQRNLPGLPALMDYLLAHALPFSFNYYRENECSANRDDLQYNEEQMIAGMRAAFAVIEQHLPRRSLLSSLIDKASLQHLHRYTCSVARNYMVIDQHGGVAKCHADIKYTVGTIEMDDPLEAIRQDRKGVQAYAVEEKEGCRTCDWRYWCTGGCPLLTYRITGRYDVKSPNCAIYMALFPEILRLEALRLLKYKQPISF